MEYYNRDLLEELKKWLDRREILAIKGPRQSGKTTLLKMLKKHLIEKKVAEENIISITFEDRELMQKFMIDPKEFVKSYTPKEEKYFFLIDEAHYCRNLGQKLKLLYDLNENIKFIITGSSSLELTNETAKYLVGRIFSFELRPFNFGEYLNAKDKRLAKAFEKTHKKVLDFLAGKEFSPSKKDIFLPELQKHFETYTTYGGYPEVVKSDNPEEREIILKNIYDTYIERDIVSFLQMADTIKFGKFVSTLSAITGNLISYESLSQTANTYFKETTKILNILEQTYIIQLLRPFHQNIITELKKTPKVYFLDAGLRNYAIRNFNELNLRVDSGALAENFALTELASQGTLNFWRTTQKAEVDFILNGATPIEVKFQNIKSPKIPSGLRSFIETYSPKRAAVLTKNFWGEEKIKETKILFIPIVYV